ncbi:MAG: hypothetical protein V1487_02235 [bacterium]
MINLEQRQAYIKKLRELRRANSDRDHERNSETAGIVAFMEACSPGTCALCIHASLGKFDKARTLETGLQALNCDGSGMPRDLGSRRTYDQQTKCGVYTPGY